MIAWLCHSFLGCFWYRFGEKNCGKLSFFIFSLSDNVGTWTQPFGVIQKIFMRICSAPNCLIGFITSLTELRCLEDFVLKGIFFVNYRKQSYCCSDFDSKKMKIAHIMPVNWKFEPTKLRAEYFDLMHVKKSSFEKHGEWFIKVDSEDTSKKRATTWGNNCNFIWLLICE